MDALRRLVAGVPAREAQRQMIHDVDESLRALVRRDALDGSGVEVAFDAPTKDWVARRNAPVVDLYLYDIREDLSRREVMWEPVRDETGRVTERRPPPRRFRLSYLVTAWTQRPEDEHRLLSGLLSCFVRNEYVPVDLLAGDLADSKLPVLIHVALPPSPDRSLADVWSALGGELKPSLDLQLIAPLDVRRSHPAGPPVLEEPRIRVEAASVPTRPDAPGRRRRSRTPASPVAAARAATPAAATTGATDDPLPEQERAVGTEDQPGRIVRLRAFRGR